MRFGVDEAGKGPVLGSMFAAAVLADPTDVPEGVADSKDLRPDRREELAASLQDAPSVHVGVAEIPVAAIDDPELDMNTLAVRAHTEALEAVPVDGHAGLLDAADTDAERFAARVRRRIDATVELDAAHGADASDNLVAAASIVAKVERDAHVAALSRSYGEDLGSGYPSDDVTMAFLADYVDEHGHLPECARESWKTSQRLLAEAEQSDLDRF